MTCNNLVRDNKHYVVTERIFHLQPAGRPVGPTCEFLGCPREGNERMLRQKREISRCCFRPSCDAAIIDPPSCDWPAEQPSTGNCLATCLQRLSHTGSLSTAFPQPLLRFKRVAALYWLCLFPETFQQIKKQEAIWSLHALTYLRSALPTHCKTGATIATIVPRCSICMFKACTVQRSSCSSTTLFTSTNLSQKVYCVTNAGLSNLFCL